MRMKPPLQQQFLHELLEKDQEPFRLKSYIADRRRSLFMNNGSRNNHNLYNQKHAATPCFFGNKNDPGRDGSESEVHLHVPSATAAVLLEASIRIQRKRKRRRRRRSMGREFASLVARLINRNRECCHHDATNESTMQAGNSCTGSEFIAAIFSFYKTPSPSAGPTPELLSPIKHKQEVKENENFHQRNSGEKGKEQSSPISTLEPLFDEEDSHRSGDSEALLDQDDYDINSSYDNLERLKQKLLRRINRYEKLAQLDRVQLGIESKLAKEESSQAAATHESNPKTSYAKIKSFNLWKGDELNTIERIAMLDWEQDRNETIKGIAGEIELGIYGLLVQELVDEQ